MWNIRMRASKAIGNQQSAISDKKIIHISGAEGIYKEKDMLQICNEYLQRAVNHPRGKPDEIVITIETIKQKIKTIPLLSVRTLKCK
ncbi:MAG: 6-carboxyhexanoate--CoA ligase, partial [Nitrospirota bacterium]